RPPSPHDRAGKPHSRRAPGQHRSPPPGRSGAHPSPPPRARHCHRRHHHALAREPYLPRPLGTAPRAGRRKPRPPAGGTLCPGGYLLTSPTVVPVSVGDPINRAILAVSEDRIQGFHPQPFQEIAARSGVPLDVV